MRHRKGEREVVTTFDIRMKAPNREPALHAGALHTIEHLAATYLRQLAPARPANGALGVGEISRNATQHKGGESGVSAELNCCGHKGKAS